MAKPIVFVVSGQEQLGAGLERGGVAQAPPLPLRGRLKQSVCLGAERGGGADVRIAAEPGKDMVVLRIAGGPALYLTPESASDLIRAQALPRAAREGEHPGDEAASEGALRVPVRLQWRGLEKTRGAASGLGDVLLDGIEVVTDAAAGLTADLVVRKVDAQVDEGVYRLRRDELPKLKESGAHPENVDAASDAEPALVLIHGTFASTSLTFDKLWKDHPEHVASIFDRYKNRVYALDHRTLGVSPITNALTLANALPGNARVHLLTHSRGGLVAEALARACASTDPAADLAFFAGKGYAQHRSDLRTLQDTVARKGIQVRRVVRVACPARGTLLASKRLDAYLSVFKWSLELAGAPVVPALVDFLAEVATRRADPAKIPGLSAQVPDNRFIEWLCSAIDPIPGDLRVVAGDIEGDSVLSWLKTLVADSFYWTDNDLVVQTRSMYGGVARAQAPTFVLDQGGKVSHFSYFSNETTAAAITEALVDGDMRRFRPIGPKSWSGDDSSGVRAPAATGGARRMRSVPRASDKPAVFVLPGILGSNLKVGNDRVWLSPRIVFGLKKLAYSPGKDKVTADGPLGLYDELSGFLAQSHEVVEFGYDWRRPLEDEAHRLADAVQEALAARNDDVPVRIVAHSMGGLLARTMLLERPQVWKDMMARDGARVLMLGTPNGGSWAPMQVLSGDDTFGNLLVAVGAPFSGHEARMLMAAFPGFIQLQAGLLDASRDLAKADTWKKLATDDIAAARKQSVWHNLPLQLAVYEWGIPTQDALDRAAALRKKLDRQLGATLAAYADRLLLVVGQSKLTPDGYDVGGQEGLVYLNAEASGDGRVTWASARLPGVRTWKLDCEHGKLPEEKRAYGAYLELLQDGTTEALAALQETPAIRGAESAAAGPARLRSRPSRERSSGQPPTADRDLFAPPDETSIARPGDGGTALAITVVNGDLKFVRHPLLLGHYRSMRLTGTEAVMDRLIGRSMSEKVKTGSYPDAPGSNQVFTNRAPDVDYPGRIPRPEAVIVAGLGPEGELRAVDLVHTVRQAVIEWSQRESEKPSGGAATFELASTLIGSGGSGISAGQSAQLIAQGVREANEKLARVRWPVVSHLHLVEIYLDRATEAWRSLQVQAGSTPSQYAVTAPIQASRGAMKRPLESGYRGADYDLISAISDQDASGDAFIAFTLDTKRARTELRAQATQGPLLRRLVESASNDSSVDDQIGRTLFRLLVPVELEPFLGGSTEMVIEVDSGTAGIPWELLDANVPGSGDRRPWAIRSKLIRKLRLADFRRRVVDAGTDERILVIGEPMCDPKTYPRLRGARSEANAIVKRLTVPGAVNADKVTALISPDDEKLPGPDARTIINALMGSDWRIVHVSGHGEPPAKIGAVPAGCDDTVQDDGDPRGVVLSDRSFLGPREIENMRVVPELVFVNCCHLAARNTGQLMRKFDRARFAATVAEKLIGIGVRCVIAAGWAVDDTTADVFATTFYDAILRGRRFIEAVADAREAAKAAGGNTWAAYQCYGDPDWVFRRERADAQSVARPINEFAGIASSLALENALETLAVESKYQGRTGEAQRVRIRFLEDRFGGQWGAIGSVACAYATAWDAYGDRRAAIRWYERAVAAPDGTAPTSAIEQLANLRVREAWGEVERALRRESEAGAGKRSNAARAKTWQGSAARATRVAAAAALAEIDEAIALLDKLIAIQPSLERTSLLASAFKRRAMVQGAAGKREDDDLARMKACYEAAERAATDAKLTTAFYPMLNGVAADLILHKGAGKTLAPARARRVRAVLEAAMRDDPEFWAAAGEIELTMYEALASAGGLRGALKQLETRYRDLYARVKAKSMWNSVYDQASFVLRRCIPARATTERRAADALLRLLESFA